MQVGDARHTRDDIVLYCRGSAQCSSHKPTDVTDSLTSTTNAEWNNVKSYYMYYISGREFILGQQNAAGIDLDIQDNSGITAVMGACANSHNTTLAILLRKGEILCFCWSGSIGILTMLTASVFCSSYLSLRHKIIQKNYNL